MNKFKGKNPFGGQSKMLYHIKNLYEYLYKGDTYPFFIEINLTSKCQLACQWCISSNFRCNDTLDTDELIKFLGDFYKYGGRAVTFSGGGEPTLHSDFKEISITAKKIGLRLGLMTNGVYPSIYNPVIGMVYDWVRFSLDTINHKKYKKWKGTDKVNQVLDNIKELKNYPVKVGINCNIFEEHTLEDIKELISIMPDVADYIQFRPVLPRYYEFEKSYINEDIVEWLDNCSIGRPWLIMSEDKFYDVVYGDLFTFESCEGHFFNPVLDANGNLCVCMYHPKDDRFVFGNIYEKSYKKIWKSKQRQQVIEFVRNLDYKNECQACCKLAEVNKLMDFINHPEKGEDIHFL